MEGKNVNLLAEAVYESYKVFDGVIVDDFVKNLFSEKLCNLQIEGHRFIGLKLFVCLILARKLMSMMDLRFKVLCGIITHLK